MSDTLITHSGGCHCGAVTFEFDAPPQLPVTVCNCSMCHATGFLHVFALQSDVRLSGADNLTTYTFNTHQAKHMFCKTCGIKPLYVPRSHPESYSINLRCITPGTLEISETIEFDGQNWEANIADLKDKT